MLEERKELIIGHLDMGKVVDYRKKLMKEIENKHFKKFYSLFMKYLPDHPDPERDHLIYSWDDLELEHNWTNIYFVCKHFECTSTYYMRKLTKLLKKLEKQAQTYAHIIYVNGNSQQLVISFWFVGDELLDSDIIEFKQQLMNRKKQETLMVTEEKTVYIVLMNYNTIAGIFDDLYLAKQCCIDLQEKGYRVEYHVFKLNKQTVR